MLDRKTNETTNTDWIDALREKLQKRYDGWLIKSKREDRAIYLYAAASSPKKEIAFIEINQNIIIIIKSLLKKRELTDSGLRVLNHLNCGLYFLTHQMEIETRVYKCRCIIEKETLLNDFDKVIAYVEGEHQKGRILLEMECR